MKPVVTDREYYIHYYEVDYKKRLLITSIMNYFGDLSIYQSEKGGVGLEYLKENNLGWVIYEWDIHINRYPRYGEKITVRTMPFSLRKFYAYRKFEIIDSKGEKIVTADSVWFLIDTNRRKPKKIVTDMYKAYGIDEDRNQPLDIKKISNLDRIDVEKSFYVRYSDIDTNRHVNNVKYVSWAIETVPKEIVIQYTLTNVKVAYKKETTYGSNISVLTEINKLDNKVHCIHKVVNSDEVELTILETVWEKQI